MKVLKTFHLNIGEDGAIKDIVSYYPGQEVKKEHQSLVPKHLIELGCVEKSAAPKRRTKNGKPNTEDK